MFNITEDVDGPLYVYYQLENFYQNHRRYVSSVNPYQLNGEVRALVVQWFDNYLMFLFYLESNRSQLRDFMCGVCQEWFFVV